MYFKKLEICGFKSFADRTKFEFEPGISAVVGPNGCGKTNVVDAIRWVLGSQSPRELRASKMEDLIFNGSQSRKPSNYAEVLLTIDNSDSSLSLDYPEVAVTRRLYRSGESEYLINKQKVRLKDIIDLFLDSGLGAGSYAVLEEARIKFILHSRPEERRELFEDAAEIGRYQYRREEAVRRLDKTKLNLSRLDDVLVEVSRQAKTIGYQVRKAKIYERYTERLAGLKIQRLLCDYRSCSKDLPSVSAEMALKKQQTDKLKKDLDNVQEQLEKERHESESRDSELLEFQSKMVQIAGEVARIEDHSRNYEQRGQELETLFSNSAQAKEQWTERKENFGRTYEQFSSELKNLENQQKELGEQLKFASNEEESENKDIESYKEKIAHEKEKESAIRSQINDIDNEIRTCEFAAEVARQKVGLIDMRTEGYQREMAEIKETSAELKMKVNGLDKEYDSATDSRHKCEASIKECSTRIKYIDGSLRGMAVWEEERKSHPSYAIFEALHQANIIKNGSRLIDLVEVPRDLRWVVGRLLGDRLFWIICETRDEAEKSINYLREGNRGYAFFLILEECTTAAGEGVQEEAAGVSIVDRLNFDRYWSNAVQTAFSGIRLVPSVSDGTVGQAILVDDTGRVRMRGGIGGGVSEGELTREHLRQEKESLGEELSRFEGTLREIDEGLHTLEVRRVEANTEISQVETITSRLEKECKQLRREKEDAEKEIDVQQQKTQGLQTGKTVLEREIKEQQSKVKECEEMLSECISKDNKLHEQVVILKFKLDGLKMAIAERQRTLETLTGEIQHADVMLSNISNNMEEIQEKIRGHKQNHIDEEGKSVALEAERDKLSKTIEKLRDDRIEAQEKMHEKQTLVERMRGQYDTSAIELSRCQLNHSEVSMKINELNQRLTQEFEISLEEALKKYPEKENEPPFDDRAIARLQRRIENLGPINMAAPEEYETLNEREKFLQTQHKDVEQAIVDLEKLIAELDRTARTKFVESFEKVRRNFQKVFNDLFEGGTSDLILTQAEDPLSAGVEIIAQPPGKRLQSITLLSAGEQTLCAIALLFAFFMAKPSPFSVLDEIDSPLDDSNIRRFANLLDQFSDQTQFLVVTHNKSTMEAADRMFGITMEEFGVSKLISVRLHREGTQQLVA